MTCNIAGNAFPGGRLAVHDLCHASALFLAEESGSEAEGSTANWGGDDHAGRIEKAAVVSECCQAAVVRLPSGDAIRAEVWS
jgi:hypothetical protein